MVVLDDLSSGKRSYVHPKAALIVQDITSDQTTQLILDEEFDQIFHFAAHMELRQSIVKPLFDANVNILGSIRILDAARASGVKNLVLASTMAVLGVQNTYPATETHSTSPISPYGTSKLAMEHYAEYHRNAYNMKVCCLRFGTVYGPRQNPNGDNGMVAIFLRKFFKGAIPTIYGDGTQTRDYVYVKDAAMAAIMAMDHNLNGTYFVATNTEVSVNAMVAEMLKYCPPGAQVQFGNPKPGDPERTLASSALFTLLTGWKPNTSIADGIAETAEWFHRVTVDNS